MNPDTIQSPRRFPAALAAAALGLAVSAAAHAAPLNDSGIRFCGAYPSGNTSPPCVPDPEGQDARFGADAAAAAGVRYKVGAGGAGFDFTKIANDGSELPESVITLGDEDGDWACTRDNTTGRVWEVKVDDAAHPRHKGHIYTWYFDPSPGGDTGVAGTTGSCGNTLGGQNCNTTTYAAAVNTAGLCGFSDWRVPTVHELKNLVDHGRSGWTIDPDYFPDEPALGPRVFWSSSPHAGAANEAWYVYFLGGDAGGAYHGNGYRVRLVRGGQ